MCRVFVYVYVLNLHVLKAHDVHDFVVIIMLWMRLM